MDHILRLCVCVSVREWEWDKATHLHMTWSLFSPDFLSLAPSPYIPVCSPLYLSVPSYLPALHRCPCRTRTRRNANVETEEKLSDKTPCANHPSLLSLTVTTFCPSAATTVASPSPYFWWCSVSRTSFSLSRSICQSACHSSVAPLSIKPVSQLVPELSFGLPCLSNANLICSSARESVSRFSLSIAGPTWKQPQAYIRGAAR